MEAYAGQTRCAPVDDSPYALAIKRRGRLLRKVLGGPKHCLKVSWKSTGVPRERSQSPTRVQSKDRSNSDMSETTSSATLEAESHSGLRGTYKARAYAAQSATSGLAPSSI